MQHETSESERCEAPTAKRRLTVLLDVSLLERGLGDILCQIDTETAQTVELVLSVSNDTARPYDVCEIVVINKPVKVQPRAVQTRTGPATRQILKDFMTAAAGEVCEEQIADASLQHMRDAIRQGNG